MHAAPRWTMSAIAVVTALVAGTATAARLAARDAHPQQTGTATSRPRIVGIAHVAFRVSDPLAARAFYGGVLGLARSTAGVRDGCVRYAVNERQEIRIEAGLPPDQDERLSHLAFETTDLMTMAQYLRDSGVTPEPDPPPTLCGSPAVWVKDPDGHAIAFVSHRPAAMAAAGAIESRAGDALSGRVLHAGLTIRDADAADRFYKAVLGFSEIWRGGRNDEAIDWINMKVPDGTDYLEYMLVSGRVSRRQLGVLHHVALLVPDIQAAYELTVHRTPLDLRDALASPQVGRNNRWQLNLYDPDGTRVELMEPFTMR